MKKIKISFWTDLRDAKYEGSINLINVLKDHLTKKEFDVSFNSKNADIIHVHSNGIMQSFFVDRLKKTNAKLIYSIYTDLTMNLLTYLRSKWDDLVIGRRITFFRRIILGLGGVIPSQLKSFKLKQFDRVIVPFEYIAKKLYKNTIVVRQGIDINRYKIIKKSNKKKIVVGYFGPFVAVKGVFDFLEATRNLPKQYAAEVHIRNLNRKTERIIKRLNKNIKVYGYEKNIVSAYNKTDIVVLPFQSNIAGIATPLVLLEAMSCGCTVITTDFPNYRNIVGKEGIILKKCAKAKDIRKAILAVTKKDMDNFGKKARERIVKYHNQDNIFKEYIKIYKNIIDDISAD